MKRLFLMTLLSVGAAITLYPSRIKADILPVTIEPPKPLTVQETIVKYAVQYAAPEKELLSVAKCESGFDPNRKGDYKNGVYLALGEFQIHEDTFWGWEKEFFLETSEHLDYQSSHDRIKLTAWIWVNRPQYRRAWTTYRALKNGGVYSFYSRQLEKYFTVTCYPMK